jgi:hypothetical protein
MMTRCNPLSIEEYLGIKNKYRESTIIYFDKLFMTDICKRIKKLERRLK